MNNLLIIGCGLIGSSILRACSKKKVVKNIFVKEKSKLNIKKLKRLKNKFTIVNDLEQIIPKMDLVIICTHMSEYEKIISSISKYLNAKTILTDVASSKEKIIKISNKKLKKGISWISSHPISGSEVSGPEHGSENLFNNKWCILIKEKKTNIKNLKMLSKFWKRLGSKIVIMDAKKHDLIFSLTSHLPHLIAYNLIKTATDFEKRRKYNLINFSAGGLRDFSRIAASNEIMWRDIFFSNNNNLSRVIDLFISNLKSFKKDILKNNNKVVLRKLKDAKKVRKKIIKIKQDINKPDFGRN
ncbi:MAG: prephenate dehydrogenase/arogenate dehydrogenase family protein [Candidatus Pelagibacterales bacterium]|nr:cyclohexadienyl dehydrogenase [Candidatus Pelagibacter sp.]RZO51479.1 MAG: prephenate dehydrogenase/arogenate dehydrogenase family protein [Pelagibacterales bacterium]